MGEIIKKNPKIVPSENGGYIVCYEKCIKANDAYGGTQYMGEGEEIFEDATKAIKRLDEIAGREDAAIMEAMAESKKSKGSGIKSEKY